MNMAESIHTEEKELNAPMLTVDSISAENLISLAERDRQSGLKLEVQQEQTARNDMLKSGSEAELAVKSDLLAKAESVLEADPDLVLEVPIPGSNITIFRFNEEKAIPEIIKIEIKKDLDNMEAAGYSGIYLRMNYPRMKYYDEDYICKSYLVELNKLPPKMWIVYYCGLDKERLNRQLYDKQLDVYFSYNIISHYGVIYCLFNKMTKEEKQGFISIEMHNLRLIKISTLMFCKYFLQDIHGQSIKDVDYSEEFATLMIIKVLTSAFTIVALGAHPNQLQTIMGDQSCALAILVHTHHNLKSLKVIESNLKAMLGISRNCNESCAYEQQIEPLLRLTHVEIYERQQTTNISETSGEITIRNLYEKLLAIPPHDNKSMGCDSCYYEAMSSFKGTDKCSHDLNEVVWHFFDEAREKGVQLMHWSTLRWVDVFNIKDFKLSCRVMVEFSVDTIGMNKPLVESQSPEVEKSLKYYAFLALEHSHQMRITNITFLELMRKEEDYIRKQCENFSQEQITSVLHELTVLYAMNKRKLTSQELIMFTKLMTDLFEQRTANKELEEYRPKTTPNEDYTRQKCDNIFKAMQYYLEQLREQIAQEKAVKLLHHNHEQVTQRLHHDYESALQGLHKKSKQTMQKSSQKLKNLKRRSKKLEEICVVQHSAKPEQATQKPTANPSTQKSGSTKSKRSCTSHQKVRVSALRTNGRSSKFRPIARVYKADKYKICQK